MYLSAHIVTHNCRCAVIKRRVNLNITHRQPIGTVERYEPIALNDNTLSDTDTHKAERASGRADDIAANRDVSVDCSDGQRVTWLGDAPRTKVSDMGHNRWHTCASWLTVGHGVRFVWR